MPSQEQINKYAYELYKQREKDHIEGKINIGNYFSDNFIAELRLTLCEKVGLTLEEYMGNRK